jgi:hypothetical protein
MEDCFDYVRQGITCGEDFLLDTLTCGWYVMRNFVNRAVLLIDTTTFRKVAML